MHCVTAGAWFGGGPSHSKRRLGAWSRSGAKTASLSFRELPEKIQPERVEGKAISEPEVSGDLTTYGRLGAAIRKGLDHPYGDPSDDIDYAVARGDHARGRSAGGHRRKYSQRPQTWPAMVARGACERQLGGRASVQL